MTSSSRHALGVAGAVALADVADAPAHAGRVGARRRGRPRSAVPEVGAQQRGEHAQGGGLAGAVRAQERDQLALGDVEVEPAHGLDGLAPSTRKCRVRPRVWIMSLLGHGSTVGDWTSLATIAARSCPQSRSRLTTMSDPTARSARAAVAAADPPVLARRRAGRAGSRSARARCAATSTGCATLGYPVDATRGVAGGYRLAAGAHLPPLLLDDDEAVAIAVGLRAAAGGVGRPASRRPRCGRWPSSSRCCPTACAAGSTPCTPTSCRCAGAAAGRPSTPTALAVLAQACRDHEQAALRLRSAATASEPRAWSSRTGSCPPGAAGTSSPGTSAATTGARSASTG